MVTIPVRSRVQPDGVLTISVPTGLPGTEVEVLVIVSPLSTGAPGAASGRWPHGFFEQTYGACAGDRLVRPEQGELEIREGLR